MGLSADVKAFAGSWVGFPFLFVVFVAEHSFFLGCGGTIQMLMLYIRMKLNVEQNFPLFLWGISREYTSPDLHLNSQILVFL